MCCSKVTEFSFCCQNPGWSKNLARNSASKKSSKSSGSPYQRYGLMTNTNLSWNFFDEIIIFCVEITLEVKNMYLIPC